MAPYNQMNNFYDPVGSNPSQPQGYTYQTSDGTLVPYISSTASNYQTPTYQNYNNAGFGDQHYNSTTHNPQPDTGDNRVAAAVLSNLGSQGYTRSGTANRSSSISSQFHTTNNLTGPGQTPTPYGQSTNRGTSNASPIYPSNAASASYGRFVSHGPSQGNNIAHNDPKDMYQAISPSNGSQPFNHGQSSTKVKSPIYQTSQIQRSNQQSQQLQQNQPPPQRYKSPLHAIQMQQSQQNQYPQPHSSAIRQLSPQMTGREMQQVNHPRQPSVDPSPTTVNPSQVYDIRAEQQRKAETEAQKRRKAEADEANRKAAEAARQAEQDRINQERHRAEEDARQAEMSRLAEEEQSRKSTEDAARKKAAQERRKEQRRKVREEKRQSDSAASALQQIASDSSRVDNSTAQDMARAEAALTDEEAQMRAMFQRMREFNQRNPAMLAQLWEEERQAHATSPNSRANKPTAVTSSQPPPSQTPSARSTPLATPKNLPPGPPTVVQQATVATPVPSHIQNRPHNNVTAPSLAIPPTGPGSRIPNMPQQPATTTLWPPHKRSTLAETASRWLNELPANRAGGRSMSKEDILKLLESNPSYVQLCEALERFGATFERSALARELLKVVPGGLRAQTIPHSGTPVTPQANGTPGAGSTNHGLDGKNRANTTMVNYQTPSFTPLADTARAINGLNAPSTVPIKAPAIQTIEASQRQDQSPHVVTNTFSANGTINSSISPERKLETATAHPGPPKVPADKEEAARKRTFSDLVDLAGGDSDDDDMPPRKLLQVYPNPTPSNTGHSQQVSFHEPMTFQQFQQAMYHTGPPAGRQHHAFQVQPPFPPNPTSPALPAVHHNVIPPPPPAPGAPPPAHVSVPRPTPVPPKQKLPTAEQQQTERIRGKMLVEPLMRDRVARKSKYDVRTIARDVLLATGRHPDMRTLNAHLNSMDKLLSTHGGAADGIGNKSDLSTIRWDIIDPDAPSKGTNTTVPAAATEDQMKDADDEDDKPTPRSTTSLKTTRPGFVHAAETGKYPEQPKRRGRPPKSAASGQRDHHDTPTSRGTMSSSATPIGASSAVGYAAFRQVDEHGNPVKKKGRPVGWRKNIHSREAHGMSPATTPSVAKPRPVTTPKKQLELQSPRYESYRCRWRDCRSELHNLDVLKKHMIKVHGQMNEHGGYECAWDGCSAARTTSGSDTEGFFHRFEDWVHHVDRQHLQNVAWELGDGPRGGTLSGQSDSEAAYLSDAHGRSVTPVISPKSQDAPEYSSVMLASGRRLNSSLSKDEHAAADELKQLEEIKQAEGPFMGTEGTRLANTKRRLGFLDDEEFADEVESSELGED